MLDTIDQASSASESDTLTEPILSARGLVKAYSQGGTQVPVLSDLSIDIYPQEIVMIAGPSGSGKSTLLAILGGLLTPDQGQVLLDGLPLSLPNPGNHGVNPTRTDASRKVGYIFQRCHLIQGLTVLDNVMLVAILNGHSKRESKRYSLELLETVGMSSRASAYPSQLSLGQSQRVAVARAFAGHPRIIFADEPTASLDKENGADVVELIRKIGKAPGRAAVIVTHDHRIFPLADRLMWVENGQIRQISWSE